MKPYWVGYGTLGGRQPFVEMDGRFEFFFVGGGGFRRCILWISIREGWGNFVAREHFRWRLCEIPA